MRPADENRVKKAIAHLDAARTILESVKYENLAGMQCNFRRSAYDNIQNTKWNLQDILNYGKQ